MGGGVTHSISERTHSTDVMKSASLRAKERHTCAQPFTTHNTQQRRDYLAPNVGDRAVFRVDSDCDPNDSVPAPYCPGAGNAAALGVG